MTGPQHCKFHVIIVTGRCDQPGRRAEHPARHRTIDSRPEIQARRFRRLLLEGPIVSTLLRLAVPNVVVNVVLIAVTGERRRALRRSTRPERTCRVVRSCFHC